MAKDTTTDSLPPQTVWLAEVPARAAGRRLGLLAGDLLLAVDGHGFTGTASDLQRSIAARAGKPVALTFQRGPDRLTVLANRADLGQWAPVAAPALPEEVVPLDPDRLSNWEILRAPDGRFDVIRTGPSLMATLLPPVWLLQMRLWVPCATFVTALCVALAVSPIASTLVWAALCLHLRQAAPAYLRADRGARGLAFHGVLAARTEAAALAAHLALNPGDRPLFAARHPDRS
jgi:hypothetical protein